MRSERMKEGLHGEQWTKEDWEYMTSRTEKVHRINNKKIPLKWLFSLLRLIHTVFPNFRKKIISTQFSSNREIWTEYPCCVKLCARYYVYAYNTKMTTVSSLPSMH